MPTQPPHHVPSQESQNPDFGFARHARSCETNPIPQGRQPEYAKRTQSTNHELPTTNYLCETNPIPEYQVSRYPIFIRNEPNFHHPPILPRWLKVSPGAPGNPIPAPPPPNMRNRPNSTARTPAIFPPAHYAKQAQFTPPIPHCAKQTQSPPGQLPTAKSQQPETAKRTQLLHHFSTYHPPLWKTNPIPQGQLPKANTQQPKNAKRTQFPYPPRTAGVSPALRERARVAG